jgi:hypothetical protein
MAMYKLAFIYVSVWLEIRIVQQLLMKVIHAELEENLCSGSGHDTRSQTGWWIDRRALCVRCFFFWYTKNNFHCNTGCSAVHCISNLLRNIVSDA